MWCPSAIAKTSHLAARTVIVSLSLSVLTWPALVQAQQGMVGMSDAPGSLVGWGRDSFGQAAPPSGDDYTGVAAGEWHSAGLRSNGLLEVWGRNNCNQHSVPSPQDFVAIGAGWDHLLGLHPDGSVSAWGCYGDGPPAFSPPGAGYVAVAGGRYHSVALKEDGSLYAWGEGNAYGELDAPSGNAFVAVAAGGNHNLALRSDGTIEAWGRNDYGQAEDPPGDSYVAAAGGRYHSLALRADGSVYAWGMNDYGQVSDTPTDDGFVAIDAGHFHNIAVKADGSVVCWGDNTHGQCDVPAVTDVNAISAGGYHNLAIVVEPLEVDIDIKPGSDPNSVACNGNLGTLIPVAILTTDAFDAMTVDHETVRFEGAMEAHHNPHGMVRHEDDVDGDGDLDLVFHFIFGETDLTQAECPSTEPIEAVLTGATFDGQAIEGSDTVRMVLAFRGCGLGVELALLLPALTWLFCRRRRSLH